MEYLDNIYNAVLFIENHLRENIALEDIALAAYYSPFHFHRLFHIVTGETPGGYLRKRRLSEAAKDLLKTKKRILDIAFDYQFQSQESFSRAFKKNFGINPGKFRKTSHCHLNYCQKLTKEQCKYRYGEITMTPEIKNFKAIKIVGMIYLGDNQKEEIVELWKEFIPQVDQVKNRINQNHCYGICFYTEDFDKTKQFCYLSCVQVDKLEDIPISMVGKTIPENTYAVFTHKGSVAEIKNTYEHIYSTWLPKSRYKIADNYDFEFYDEKFNIENPETSSMYIYIPVEKKT